MNGNIHGAPLENELNRVAVLLTRGTYISSPPDKLLNWVIQLVDCDNYYSFFIAGNMLGHKGQILAWCQTRK